ncbi:MAG: NAD(P)H-hydrate dehydratase, partial [Planctomycetaceae bacterium]
LTGIDAVAVGPGLGTSSQVRGFVRRLWSESPSTLIVDADALNVLAEDFRSQGISPEGPGTAAALRVLTPHPGEFARLCGVSIAQIEQDRQSAARDFAQRHGVLLILKGPGTIVTDGDRLTVNPTGNSGMATGGSGDVLTGLLCALLARADDPFEATRLAVWLHGRAGDLAAAEHSEASLIASDLPLFFGRAWQELSTESERTG